MTGIESICDSEGSLLAVVVSHHYDHDGVTFVTPPDLSQQLAYIHHPAGHTIPAHRHIPVARKIQNTQETLFVKRGRLRVDFYNSEQAYMGSTILRAGDALLLVSGGHGFACLDDVEMFEVKQGPYTPNDDKVRFAGISAAEVKDVGVVGWQRSNATSS